VRHLVHNGEGGVSLAAKGGGFGIEQEVGFAEGDGAEVSMAPASKSGMPMKSSFLSGK